MSLQLFPAESTGPGGYAAVLSACGLYRYALHRPLIEDGGRRRCLFVMLNPSTADAHRDDATIRKVMTFAEGWGFRWLDVANLFAWRATDPKALRKVADPVGPENDGWIARLAASAELVIAAWGANGGLLERDAHVAKLLERVAPGKLHLIRKTKTTGKPEHPLFLPGYLTPQRWEGP